MSIISMFYTVVIPIKNLKRILSVEELQKALAERKYKAMAWFDDCLYCEGSMSPGGNEIIIKYWESKGLIPTEMVNGEEHWKDLCLVSAPDNQPTAPCDWVEIFSPDKQTNFIRFKDETRSCYVKEISSAEEFVEAYKYTLLESQVKSSRIYYQVCQNCKIKFDTDEENAVCPRCKQPTENDGFEINCFRNPTNFWGKLKRRLFQYLP